MLVIILIIISNGDLIKTKVGERMEIGKSKSFEKNWILKKVRGSEKCKKVNKNKFN